MSKIQQAVMTSPKGITLATKEKYCPYNLRITPRLATLTVTANGTYPIPAGFAGYGTVSVAVSEEGLRCQHPETDTAVLREPTCTEAGEATVTCRSCGASWLQILPRLSHRDILTVKAPTCTHIGYTLHTCALCGRSYTDSEVPALGHDWGDSIPDASFSTGYALVCARCGEREEASP